MCNVSVSQIFVQLFFPEWPEASCVLPVRGVSFFFSRWDLLIALCVSLVSVVE
jgi:hypothetical protein